MTVEVTVSPAEASYAAGRGSPERSHRMLGRGRPARVSVLMIRVGRSLLAPLPWIILAL